MPSNRHPSALLMMLMLLGLVATPGWVKPALADNHEDPATCDEEVAEEDAGTAEEEEEAKEEIDLDVDEEAGPPFAEALKDCERIDGFVTFYQDKKSGQTYLALEPDQLDKVMLCSTTINAGSGGGMFIAPMLGPDFPLKFKRTYRTVQVIQPNTMVRANESAPIAGAVKSGTSDSILVTLPLAAQPAPEPADDAEDAHPKGTLLLDANALFIYNDLLGLGMMGVGADPMGSFISDIQGFDLNTNVELTYNMVGGGGPGLFGAAGLTPDPRSTIVKLVMVLSELPNDDFVPRLSDERIGYFLTMYQDFTTDDQPTRYVRYINRWDLEKKDPTAAVSDPVEPIVYWIENTVPHKYRAAVKEGIEAWQPAFEAAGFSNAIIAKQMPDDAAWDPADVRYNVIRWFVAPGAGFAIGPSRANPYTGQIYDADIGFSADMLAFGAMEYQYLVNPLASITRERQRARMMGMALPPTVMELGEMPNNPELRSFYAQEKARMLNPQPLQTRGRQWQMCNFAAEAAEEAASALATARGVTIGEVDEEEFMRQFVVSLVLHEVGHTLGLRHNYKASTYHTFAELGTEEAAKSGLTGSVMDYTGTNIASRDQTQGEYMQTHVGPYDIAAITYGYTPIPDAGTSPQAALPTLNGIASDWAKSGYGYATDEDQYGWTAAMDPSVVAWDLGKDNLAYYEDQLKLANQLFGRMQFLHNGQGDRYQEMRKSFGWGLRSYNIAMGGVPRYIGGIYHSRNRVGDPNGSLPYTPVSADEQRAALNLIMEYYWAEDAFNFDPEILRKLAVEREPDFYGTTWEMQRRDIPIHDIVLGLQMEPLIWIYDPLTLGRMADSAKMLPAGTDILTTAELFGAVRGDIWQEAFEMRAANSYRRNLQRQHLLIASTIYLYGDGWFPPDVQTLARLDLMTLQTALAKASQDPHMDGLSRAHYAESLARINDTLNAQVMKLPLF